MRASTPLLRDLLFVGCGFFLACRGRLPRWSAKLTSTEVHATSTPACAEFIRRGSYAQPGVELPQEFPSNR